MKESSDMILKSPLVSSEKKRLVLFKCPKKKKGSVKVPDRRRGHD